MKKVMLWMVAVCFLGMSSVAQEVPQGRGGLVGFIAGCCFGVRAAGAYNSGKDLHLRDFLRLIPFVAIWDGIEGANGMTTSDYAKKYGSAFY